LRDKYSHILSTSTSSPRLSLPRLDERGRGVDAEDVRNRKDVIAQNLSDGSREPQRVIHMVNMSNGKTVSQVGSAPVSIIEFLAAQGQLYVRYRA